jgi:hypothetical protein
VSERAKKNFSPPAAHRVMNDEQLDEPFDVSVPYKWLC